MWYRVEYNKDDSVKSCIEVETKTNEGRLVVFVEAESRDEAIVNAKLYREKRRAYYRVWKAIHRAKGLCDRCKNPALKGRTVCEAHRYYSIDHNKKRKLGITGKAKTVLDPRKSRNESSNKLRNKFGGSQAYRNYLAIKMLLVKYLEDPSGFEVWCRTELQKYESGFYAKEPEPQAAE